MTNPPSGYAGAATVNVTPPNPVAGYLGNVFIRGNEDSDILAHAVVVIDGNTSGATVSVDVVLLDRATASWAKERFCQNSGPNLVFSH
jgi:hypothetical protein